MPQPLSRVTQNTGVLEINNIGTRTVAQRPALAVMALECIASWSHVESFMLNMYVELAGGAEADAAAVYLAMETNSAKSTAISILAERKLDADQLKLLRAIIKVAKSAQKERDKLAHWVWGTSTNLPDALLLSDPRNLQFNNDLIFVYTADDFEAMRRKFERIAGFGFEFRWILMGHPANRDGELYAKLCREPEIAEILRRQAQQD